MALMFKPTYTRQMGSADDIKRTFNGLEVSEGTAPSNKFLVDPRVSRKFKYQFNVKQDDWVCIPKGLIVGIATNADYETSGVSGAVTTNTNNAGAGHYFKEFESKKLYHAITIANGGVDVAGEADQRRIDLGIPTATYTRTANIPLGVLFKNAYYKIDDRMFGSGSSIITRPFIELPYVPDRSLANLVAWGCATGGDGNALDPGYLRPGDFVKSDARGHFVKWNPGTLTAIPYVGGATFVAAVAATASLNLADAGTGMNAADTVVIGSVTLTAIAAAATAAADTATTGEFKIGTDAAGTTANLLAKINAHAATSALVTASEGSATDIITLTANTKGRVGNSITLTGNARCEVASAFAGGVDAGFSSNAATASTASLYVGADDPRQIVGQVWDVTGQLQPEGWLQWVMWNLDMADDSDKNVEDLQKLLGLKAQDLQLPGYEYGYPALDKYLNQWRYAPEAGRGIEGLTDGANIVKSITNQKIYRTVPRGTKAGEQLYFNIPREQFVANSIKIGALNTSSGEMVGTPAGIGEAYDAGGIKFTFDRFENEMSQALIVITVTEEVASEVQLAINYDATGMVPGVPTMWDLKGSIGGVRILLGGLGK